MLFIYLIIYLKLKNFQKHSIYIHTVEGFENNRNICEK